MKKVMLAGLIALTALPALAAPGGAERQQSFKKLLRSFEPMGLMVREREPYKKDEFIKHADALKKMAAEPFTLFAPNSIDAKSRSKPEIWTQPAKFAAEKDKFLKAVDELDATAKTGDLAQIKKSFGGVAQTCKSCHDAFRGPER
ncbi:c-type cytochrome [Paludibacterium paludis]|uniref:Cytochrome c n=1 Tax=Paludibacterium paludis TaxID=1225769 RepID=A0A918UB02_9NEIS|nr:cytochrome c [Paludibacterium paludis]GGY19341.1 cytochrome c [Paludibacterium paludis]